MFLKTIFTIVFSLCVGVCVHSVDVKTTSGLVRGKAIEVLKKSVNQFHNIPYAEPPVGKLRFAKPVPLKEPKHVMKQMID